MFGNYEVGFSYLSLDESEEDDDEYEDKLDGRVVDNYDLDIGGYLFDDYCLVSEMKYDEDEEG